MNWRRVEAASGKSGGRGVRVCHAYITMLKILTRTIVLIGFSRRLETAAGVLEVST